MARINVDDDIESRPEYRKLLKLLEGDDDRALGMLVRFWRHAQRLWAHGHLVSEEDMNEWGWAPLVASKWAVRREGGFYAIGAEERFAWYAQKVQNGKKGGRPKIEVSPAEPERTEDNLKVIPANPLAPAPVLAPSQNIYAATQEQIGEAIEEWSKTLARYSIEKPARLDAPNIVRLIQRHGFEKTKLALRGAGFEAPGDKFIPAKHCRITRLDKPDIFEKFVNLGAQNQPASRDVYRPEDTAC